MLEWLDDYSVSYTEGAIPPRLLYLSIFSTHNFNIEIHNPDILKCT